MPYSKNPATYPKELRELLQHAANADERVELPLPPTTESEAIRYRALFYALRKVLIEKFNQESNIDAVERLSSVSMRMVKLPSNYAQLTIANGYGGFDENFLAGVQKLVDRLGAQSEETTSASPGIGRLTPEQQQELQESIEAARREREETENSIATNLAPYRSEGFNPYLSEDSETSDEDRLAWEEHQRSIESDELESKHSRYATPEERKAAKEKKQ